MRFEPEPDEAPADKELVEPPDIPARLDELNPDAIRLALELAWSIRFWYSI